MGSHLGIDFSWILVDLGSQVGRQNRAMIAQKWHRKKDEKKKRKKNEKKRVMLAPQPGVGQGSARYAAPLGPGEAL